MTDNKSMAEGEAKEQKAGEQKEEKLSPPLILEVELHCSGCIRKIRKSVLQIRGVEDVEIDVSRNQVKIKGVVSPQQVCDKISQKTKRTTKVISPSETDPLPQLVISQVSGLTSVELITFLHCEACARHLNRKILKMRGVQTAAADFSSGKVTVTGTMDPNKLVEYVYKHTKKQAQIIIKPKPEPEPEPLQEEKGAAADTADSNKAAEPEEDGAVKGGQEKPQEEGKKEESGGAINGGGEKDNEFKEEAQEQANQESGDEDRRKMMIMPQITTPSPYYYQPIYVMERIPPPYPPPYPPPMLFSDENPNACCVS